MSVIDEFLAEHAQLEAGLTATEGAIADPARLAVALRAMKPLVTAHFQRKDQFYVDLAQRCDRAKDPAGAQLTRIFEQNMKVQSAAVRRFFETLEAAQPASLAPGFRTVLTVVRQRLGTEEKAIFPIYHRTVKALETP